MAPAAKKKEPKGSPTPEAEQGGGALAARAADGTIACARPVLRLSLRAHPAAPAPGVAPSQAGEEAAEGGAIASSTAGQAGPRNSFLVSYSIWGQPEGQGEAVCSEPSAVLEWNKDLDMVVDETFVRSAVAAYGRICVWLRPQAEPQDPPPRAASVAKEGAKEKKQARPPSGKTGGEATRKNLGSAQGKAAGGQAGPGSASMKRQASSKSKGPSPQPTGKGAGEMGMLAADSEGPDRGEGSRWEREGACLLLLEAAPLLTNHLHVERTFLVERKAEEGRSSEDVDERRSLAEGPSSGPLRLESMLAGYSKVEVAATLTQKLLPDSLAVSLNPVVITPVCLRSLPDQPASAHALDSLCEPITAELRLPGLSRTFIRAAVPQPWRVPAPSTVGERSILLQVRDALFEGPPCILLAGVLPAGRLYEELLTSPLEVVVHDRTPAGGTAPPLFATAPAAEATQLSDAGAAGPTSSVAPSPVLKAGHGVARLDVAALCEGEVSVKVRAPLYPVSTTAAEAAGEEHDWRTRPGLYMQAQSSITVRADAALPLTEAPGTERPFGRVVVRMGYGDGQLLGALLAQVRGVNARTLQLEGEEQHVLKMLATMQLTTAQQADTALDVITGFQVVDARVRLVVVEGLRGGSLSQLEALLREQQQGAPASVHVAMNPDIGFQDRLYGALGADVQLVKLRSCLSDIAHDPAGAVAGKLKHDCQEGVARLATLCGVPCLRRAGRLFPSAAMVEAVYRKYGGETTLQDVTGHPLHAHTDTLATSLVGKQLADEQESTSPGHVQGANRKGRTDSCNEEFIKLRLTREAKDRHKENLARIEALSASSHAARVAVQAPQRAVVLQDVRNTRPIPAPAYDTSLHKAPFVWPAPREPDAFRSLPHQPSDARREELRDPWVEDPLSAAAPQAVNGVPFQTVVAPPGGALFEREAGFFTSVFAAADALTKKKSIGRDADTPTSGPPFATVAPLRKAVGQLDKYAGLLHNAPAKPGLTGRGRLSTCPVSTLSMEPYVEAGAERTKVDPATFISKNVDFRRHISPPKTSVAKRSIPGLSHAEKTFQRSTEGRRHPIEHPSTYKVTSWYTMDCGGTGDHTT